MSKVITRKMLRRIIAEQAKAPRTPPSSTVGPPPAVRPPSKRMPSFPKKAPDASRLSDDVEQALSLPLKNICRQVDETKLEWGLRLHITISEDRDIDVEVKGKKSWSSSQAKQIAEEFEKHRATKDALSGVEPGLYKYVVLAFPSPRA